MKAGFLKRLFSPKSVYLNQVKIIDVEGKPVPTLALSQVHRRLQIYVRALWGRECLIRPPLEYEPEDPDSRPGLRRSAIRLPQSMPDWCPPGHDRIKALEVYRAASAHCSAHQVFSLSPPEITGLTSWEKTVIGLFEDARIETLAYTRFPGLKRLWARQHVATPASLPDTQNLLDRLARALIDPDYQDPDPWVEEGRQQFSSLQDPWDNHEIWAIGKSLAHRFRDRGLPLLPPAQVRMNAPYRDDNLHLWDQTRFDIDVAEVDRDPGRGKLRQFSSWLGLSKEAYKAADDDEAEETQEIPKYTLLNEIFNIKLAAYAVQEEKDLLDEEGEVMPPFRYPEWDYSLEMARDPWVTLREKCANTGEVSLIDDILVRYKRHIGRMKFLLDAIQPDGVQRIRKLEEGDEIDINAAIRARIDLINGSPPDPRIMMRSVRRVRDISILVLLDLSRSTNEKVGGQQHTVLELTREACVLLADAINKVGDPFAIHGFCSDSRKKVRYYRLKDFNQPYDDVAKSRLAGMKGQLSTRMGAAIRHATHYLGQQHTTKKLLMIITDGAPSDIDVRDGNYLILDSRQAVEEARAQGLFPFCLSLDHEADRYVSRIFGIRNFLVIDHVSRLPEKLPLIYAGLTR